MKFLQKISSWFSNPVEARLEQLTSCPKFRPVALSSLTEIARHPAIELFRDAGLSIRHVRIGGWRVIAASKLRRIAEVRPLVCGRVAVRIEREDPERRAPCGTTWELYDLQGHLLSMLQIMPDEDFWLETDFETGRVSHSPLSAELHLSA